MPSDFDDRETDVSRGGGGGTRLHAVISVDGAVTTKLLPGAGEITLGRASSCDVVIPHSSVSRHHATLQLAPLQIIDAGSRNGTRVQGRPIPRGTQAALSVGDPIQIGEVLILLQSVPMSFDGKPMLDALPLVEEDDAPPQPVDAECARAARTGSPFAIVQLLVQDGRSNDVHGLLRGMLRTTDVIRSDGAGGFQLLLVDTAGDHVALALARMRALLRQHGVTVQIGVARYPEDGVAPDQLIARAYEQLTSSDGEPSAMDGVRELVRQVAGGDLSVLIGGETGVGKELCAEMIHRLSPRASKPFVKLNCSAFVESLIESELFGHEKGAFTGATTAHPGLLETGNGGTVFLDEIGELPLGVQSKLLRVLEERVVRRVGATTNHKVDVRFVCATNRDLAEEVNAGRFRRDLYYRINGVTIRIPSLRERRNEIAALARAFASRARPGAPITLGSEVVSVLEHHSWPGNIRELRNTIDRAALLSSGGTIRPSHLVLETPREPIRESQPTMPIERFSSESITNPGISRPSEQSLASEVAELERKRIVATLEHFGGNQTQAARALGVSRTTLIARMEEYALRRPRKRD